MNAIDAPAQSVAAPRISSAELEASASAPILLLLLGAAVWLVLAALLALICSVKLHMPTLLAAYPLLTYGRLAAASDTALLYGFAVPAALASSLWLLCRQGRTRMAGAPSAVLGVFFWHLTIAAGIWGILRGAGTGYEAFEIPHSLAPILFASYLIIATCGAATFHNRQPGILYPSQWFVVGALFWFAWIFSTAAMLLLWSPVRGVLQATVDWWYENNFSNVFLGFAGLAPIFYFIPKLTGRPLHSRYLAAFAFWLLALAGSGGGFPNGAPLPGWLIASSMFSSVFLLIPILSVATNLHLTTHGSTVTLEGDTSFRFFCAGIVCWLIAGVQQCVGAIPSVASLTDFTWFIAAQHNLFRYGFFAMTMFGVIYYMVPRLADPKSKTPESLWCPHCTRLHFWLTLIGVFVGYISLLVGGLWQGVALDNAGNSFALVMNRTMMAIRMSTLAPLLLFVGSVVFLFNFSMLLKNCCCRCCREKSISGTTSKEAA